MKNFAMVNRRHAMGLIGGAGLIAFAGETLGQHVYKEIHALKPGEFTWHPDRQPDGPVAVIVSIDEQLVHVYRNGVRIAVSTCSTGKAGHQTPAGVFVVLQKDRDHRSSTYNNAPMPNMNRLTWSGIALHAGNLPGYPASHGCVRLPLEFSELLFEITHLGTPVIIADSHHSPDEVVHPGFILSGYSEAEFEEALSNLSPKKHPSDWVDGDEHPITSMIVSSHDGEITLIENNVAIATGPLIWDGQAFGPHTYVLHEAHEDIGGMKWSALTHENPEDRGKAALESIKSDKEFAEMVVRYAHPGMILVTTDLPLHPDLRSGRDWVIMT